MLVVLVAEMLLVIYLAVPVRHHQLALTMVFLETLLLLANVMMAIVDLQIVHVAGHLVAVVALLGADAPQEIVGVVALYVVAQILVRN